MKSIVVTAFSIAVLVFLLPVGVAANPPESSDSTHVGGDRAASARARKEISQPNPLEYTRVQRRHALHEYLDRHYPDRATGIAQLQTDARAAAAAATTTDRVLVILVEFAGTDSWAWTPGLSLWDPFGYCDASEFDGVNYNNAIASSNIAAKYGVVGTTNFTYWGPLHNEIARPWSAEDRSGDMIWTPDFSTAFYHEIIFGNGWVLDYTRTNGSVVYEDYRGYSVRHYYEDQSRGAYTFTGVVLGWVRVPHSVWWYGADPCPGRRSGTSAVGHHGAIPGAGSARTLVVDAIEAAKSAYPSFDWAAYDLNHDGLIDRLWIIHAGLGEEDSIVLLNRTSYREGGLWSHASSLSPAYQIVPGVSAGPYIMMSENCGIGVLAHEYGHNLGTIDLYAYNGGETSAGFWTLMADDWTGYPIGYLPPALDPWHVDGQGWLDPVVVNTPAARTVTVWQASGSAGGPAACRAVKIVLPDQRVAQPVRPIGNYAWWGGYEDLANAMMTLTTPLSIPAAGATLRCDLAYSIETGWDFLWVQVSTNNGATWIALSNAFATSQHETGWIGASYGMEGAAGFTGVSPGYPAFTNMSFSLNAFANQIIRLRFWYMTDWSGLWDGPFVDNISITAPGGIVLFSDNAESGDTNWVYTPPWRRTDGYVLVTHNYYLQYRNTGVNGGYDRCLGDPRWRFGPANTGLLIWYNNNRYSDNEIFFYLNDSPGFGPKGRALVVDAHPEPYRDPYWVAYGYSNEAANVHGRSQMRDAPFSLWDSVTFTMRWDWVYDAQVVFAGRPAVSVFDDYFGYYPGAEYVSRAPSNQPPVYIWLTKHWDASVVLPSTVHYGIKAPGYTNEPFRFRASRWGVGYLSTWWYPSGLGYNGGSGNPGDYGGNYGVNVRILSQTPSNATVVIAGVPEPVSALVALWIMAIARAARRRAYLRSRRQNENS